MEAVEAVLEYMSEKDHDLDSPLTYDEYEIILEALTDGGVHVEELKKEAQGLASLKARDDADNNSNQCFHVLSIGAPLAVPRPLLCA